MALNPNHTFEELDGVKCSIVEKDCNANRSEFLKKLLEYNGYNVILQKKAPKPVPKPAVTTEQTATAPEVVAPDSFTIGVTDVTFNPVKAIYRRELKTPNGHFVTPEFWRQEETTSHDELWYWQN